MTTLKEERDKSLTEFRQLQAENKLLEEKLSQEGIAEFLDFLHSYGGGVRESWKKH
ncbi:MAG: hypothetical protein HXX20_18420 [Chloroflexi bacterium]|nr:hypothetical protein [Chloroflexota bacterium]